MAITDRMMKGCSLSTWRGAPLRCRWCNSDLTGRQKRWCSKQCGDAAFNNHWFSSARKSLMRIATLTRRRFCVKCGARGPLEANHKIPCLGAHGKASCVHHIDLLELCCRKCHLEITKAQRAAGLLKRSK